MSFALALRIAYRQLLGRRRLLVGSIATIAIAGAVATVVLATSLAQYDLLRTRLAALAPAVTLLPERLEPLVPRRLVDVEGGVVELVVNTPPHERREIKPRAEVSTRARRSSRQITEVAPFVQLNGAFRNGAQYRAVELYGIDPVRHQRMTGVADAIKLGSLAALKSDPEAAIVGLSLARRLGLHRTGTVTLITSAGVVRRLRVVGIFRSDVRDVDDVRVYVNLELAQTLRGMARNAVTGLGLDVRAADRIERVARIAERATGYRSTTWENDHAATLSAYRIRAGASLSLAALLAVIVTLVVAYLLRTSSSAHRTDAIALAHSGAVRTTARSLVVMMGSLLGLAGGIVGVAVGVAGSSVLARTSVGVLRFADPFIRFDRVPVSIETPVLLAAFGVCAAIGVVAGVAAASSALERQWRTA